MAHITVTQIALAFLAAVVIYIWGMMIVRRIREKLYWKRVEKENEKTQEKIQNHLDKYKYIRY